MSAPNNERPKLPAQAHPGTDFDYELVAINHNSAVDPGDEVMFDLYISGYGSPPRNKLTVLTNPSILPDTHEIGAVSLSADGLVDWDNNEFQEITIGSDLNNSGSYNRYIPLTRYGITIGVPRILFADDFEWGKNLRSNPDIEAEEIIDRYYPRTLSEKVLSLPQGDVDQLSVDMDFSSPSIDGDEPITPSPPMRFKIQTSEDAKPGDYDIRLVLVMGDDENVLTISDTVTVHIKNTREQLEPVPTTAAVLGALIALLSLVYTTGVFGLLLEFFG